MEVSREHINSAANAVYEDTSGLRASGCNPSACAAVCDRTAAMLGAELAAVRAAGAVVACAPGCAFCCHQRVSAFPHEAIALWRHLRTALPAEQAAAIERRILENARAVDRMTVGEHYAANLRCALLVDGRCSAYVVRPSACALYHSLSRERCEHSYNHPTDIGTWKNSRPALLEMQAFGDAVVEAARAGLERAGLASGKGELHQLLRALLENPDLVERWHRGGDLAAESVASADCGRRQPTRQ
jgi:Fe-S-cluster containining protein